jgi:hypothetical protein
LVVLAVVAYRVMGREFAGVGEQGAPIPTSELGGSPAAPTPGVAPPVPLGAVPSLELSASFNELRTTISADVGLSVAPIGGGDQMQSFGDWTTGPAWSTIKIPLSLALLRADATGEVPGSVRAAITQSDNAAAQSIWEQLGDSEVAAGKVESVLLQAGDPTQVQSLVTRPGFSAFGQTDWSLVNQVRFLAAVSCDDRNQPVFDLMADIVSGQRWGLGSLDGARFKGGWGPGTGGGYLVRQFGVITIPGGELAVAMAATPASGSFSDGTADLGTIASWVAEHVAEFRPGSCGPA